MDRSIGDSFLPLNRHDTYPAIELAKADLSGKVVVVTGASRGIGKDIAVAMAQGGAKGLVLLARAGLDAAKADCRAAARPGSGLEVLAVEADITKNDQVVAAAKRAEATFGRVDIVINNAGYLEQYNFIADSEPDEWWKTFEVNVRGTYQVSRAFLPLLIKCGGDKTIVNLTSPASIGFLPQFSAYSISKLAQLRFTEWVGVEYGDKGVIAYSVNPGMHLTDMGARMPPEIVNAPIWHDKPALPAHTLLWLVNERREWLSGRYLDCRWDVEALLAKKQEVIDGEMLKFKMIV
ncbi:SDR family oxidoreductase [Phanerochaete sordida]|uniref:SDR family oxidoreductase n=1 Tax=Phanerochaete sordida TaxID=48140 RepID=A0A9P3GMN5_9APHY|nr:SDR family oxidoreductase [Phanerochaete sordida]